MPKSQRQKLKLLYLRKILRERTDDAHRLSAAQLVQALAEYGISAERKSIYQDIDCLAELGEDIIRFHGRGAGFAVGAREFELAELRMLVDIVSSSRFLTADKSQALIAKMKALTSRYEAAALGRQVHVSGRVHSENQGIFRNVDALHAAMADGTQVSFRYFKWGLAEQGGFEKVYRRGGAPYEVSPWALIWDNLNYYLAGYDAAAGALRHYRVDKMEDICALGRPRVGQTAYAAHRPVDYQRIMFGMFHGQEEQVTLRARLDFADVLRDRFGEQLCPTRVGPDCLEVSVRVIVSPQFFGWLAGLEGHVWITAPVSVSKAYRRQLRKILSGT